MLALLDELVLEALIVFPENGIFALELLDKCFKLMFVISFLVQGGCEVFDFFIFELLDLDAHVEYVLDLTHM